MGENDERTVLAPLNLEEDSEEFDVLAMADASVGSRRLIVVVVGVGVVTSGTGICPSHTPMPRRVKPQQG